ncbi:SCO family protein [uncultured Alsobacter sp.]|uniref:SCO family protein n=1 Tax=uncultured Alsobacter sp. TaxID=1748258 RepID=UPI0025EDCA32|nr:SCO family protein [uncultured Alsobacter sp.]
MSVKPGPDPSAKEKALARRLALPLLAFVFGAVALLMAVAVVFMPREGQQVAAVGGPFSLVDQDGKAFTEKDLLGKPSLVFFGFTHCPDVCPTTLYEITQVYSELAAKGDKVRAVFVTVDPARDTPELMKTYLSSFDPHIVGLSGSQAAVDGIMKAYRVFARKVPGENGNYTMDHTALVYLMDAKGRFVGAFNLQKSPAEAAKELERYM